MNSQSVIEQAEQTANQYIDLKQAEATRTLGIFAQKIAANAQNQNPDLLLALWQNAAHARQELDSWKIFS